MKKKATLSAARVMRSGAVLFHDGDRRKRRETKSDPAEKQLKLIKPRIAWTIRRVASHLRIHETGNHVTKPEHMPAAHRKYVDWTPSRLIRWAHQTVDAHSHTAALMTAILAAAKPHPERGYRACLGIMRLAKEYERERVENAAQRALA